MKHVKLFETFTSINEEEYDFIRDFQSKEGRRPTREEIDRLYYGRGKHPEGPKVQYIQPSNYKAIKIGDKVRNKKTGVIYTVIKEPYHRIWREYPDYEYGTGYSTIDVKDESGKSLAVKMENYEKILSAEEEIQRNQDELKRNSEIDKITKALIDRGLFGEQEVPSGKMLNSFSTNKLKHNEEIRNAITEISDEMGISSSIKDEYWKKFW